MAPVRRDRVGTGAADVAVLLLLENISARKEEARQVIFRLVRSTKTRRSGRVGQELPPPVRRLQADRRQSPHAVGGSEAFSKLDADPRLRRFFAGYAFSVDYREGRGHAYMLDDQRSTRVSNSSSSPAPACTATPPSRCLPQGGPRGRRPGYADDPLTSENGYAQLMKGFEVVCSMPYAEATKLVEAPRGLHRLPRSQDHAAARHAARLPPRHPALAERRDPCRTCPPSRHGARATARPPTTPTPGLPPGDAVLGLRPVPCRVLLRRKTPSSYPWNNGLKVEQSEAYYDSYKFPDGHRFFDWKHAAPAPRCSRPSIPSSRCGARASTPAAASPAPIATCPTSARVRSRSATTTCAARCSNISRACQTCHRFPARPS